ncbi:MAG TPA: acyl-CoA dehydrogenase family protein, partial [Pseudomonadales bacterium]|nr:acyl-CoA dehydrogenase family protein [Pseudomonadales bacterium]
MIDWNETQRMMRDMIKNFIQAEIVPNLEQLEHGDMPPYDILRKMMKTFGMDTMAKMRFDAQIALEKRIAAGEVIEKKEKSDDSGMGFSKQDQAAMAMIPIIELCRYCPGMVTAMGVSVGLTAGAIMSKGTIAQKERWALPLLTMEKVGSWAITEPNSGSDAFGSMRASARKNADGTYTLNGNKTFITNGPHADTIVFICKLEDKAVEMRDRKILSFILDRGMPGLTQTKPLRKMGLHSSPTGELFLQDVVVTPDRLIGETEEVSARSGAKDTFSSERAGVAAMALGIVERCLELSVNYAKTRVQFGKPIADFQLIQEKLAKMEVARVNLQNMVYRYIELVAAGRTPTLAEASAMKLYAARAAMEVALEAVQVHGGNGYMAEYQVEQLCRDAKILQIYAGTDEIQIT